MGREVTSYSKSVHGSRFKCVLSILNENNRTVAKGKKEQICMTPDGHRADYKKISKMPFLSIVMHNSSVTIRRRRRRLLDIYFSFRNHKNRLMFACRCSGVSLFLLSTFFAPRFFANKSRPGKKPERKFVRLSQEYS